MLPACFAQSLYGTTGEKLLYNFLLERISAGKSKGNKQTFKSKADKRLDDTYPAKCKKQERNKRIPAGDRTVEIESGNYASIFKIHYL